MVSNLTTVEVKALINQESNLWKCDKCNSNTYISKINSLKSLFSSVIIHDLAIKCKNNHELPNVGITILSLIE